MTKALQSLLTQIARQPHEFDFFQALRRVEAISLDHPRLGHSDSPSQDVIRLGQVPFLNFAPRALASVTGLGEDGHEHPPAHFNTFFFGLFGPNGPLPLHLTEYAFSRLHNGNDATLTRFADIFHHRMMSLFFRAWAESEPTVSHDRPEEDRFGCQLGALAGFGMSALRDRDRMPDLAKLHFTGRLASHTRNPEGLQAILASFFATTVHIDEFVPNWVQLSDDVLCHLGVSPATGTLGSTLTAGARIKVHHHRFRIVIGPLRLVSYIRLVPEGDGLARLLPIVRNYIGEELEFEINLVLRSDEVPAVRLGKSGRLGWTAWLGRHAPDVDARDFLITASSAKALTARRRDGDGPDGHPSGAPPAA